MDNNKSTHLLHRRYSERRHRYQRRPSISMATDTWSTPRHYTEREEEEEEEQVKGVCSYGSFVCVCVCMICIVMYIIYLSTVILG